MSGMNVFAHILRVSVVVTLAVALPFVAYAKEFVVVIDAGHGGKDVGTTYSEKRGKKNYIVYEKTVNLAIAKSLQELFDDNEDDVKIVLTRGTDVFIPLGERSNISNEIEADAFISIHCNAVNIAKLSAAQRKRKRERYYGCSVLVINPGQLGRLENLSDEARLERLENVDRSHKIAEFVLDELSNTAGRKNNGIIQSTRDLALFRNTIAPTIIAEVDYLSNPTAQEFLASKDGQKKIARAIYNAVIKFKNYCTSLDGDYEEVVQEDCVVAENGVVSYSVQFLTASSVLADNHSSLRGIKGYKYSYYVDRGLYKYITGKFATEADAGQLLDKIRKSYPDAFVIQMKDGKRVK